MTDTIYHSMDPERDARVAAGQLPHWARMLHAEVQTGGAADDRTTVSERLRAEGEQFMPDLTALDEQEKRLQAQIDTATRTVLGMKLAALMTHLYKMRGWTIVQGDVNALLRVNQPLLVDVDASTDEQLFDYLVREYHRGERMTKVINQLAAPYTHLKVEHVEATESYYGRVEKVVLHVPYVAIGDE